MEKRKISEQVIKRLPRYYRYLCDLSEQGVQRISSRELGRLMHLTASQIRQDFNCFGGFGQQGLGYYIQELKQEISQILGLDQTYQMILVGAGNIGHALAQYEGFARMGFFIRAVFDVNPALIGQEIGCGRVRDAAEIPAFLAENPIEIAVLVVNAPAALSAAERLKELGIRHIWNFAPVDIVLDGMVVENMNISDSLAMLSYHMKSSAL